MACRVVEGVQIRFLRGEKSMISTLRREIMYSCPSVICKSSATGSTGKTLEGILFG